MTYANPLPFTHSLSYHDLIDMLYSRATMNHMLDDVAPKMLLLIKYNRCSKLDWLHDDTILP